MTSVGTRTQDAVLTAIENLLIPRVELAMKSANSHSERIVDGNVLEHDQRDFLGNIKVSRMTAFSRINTHTGLNRIDDTRGRSTVEAGDLLFHEMSIDRQTHAHYMVIGQKAPQKHLTSFLGTFQSTLIPHNHHTIIDNYHETPHYLYWKTTANEYPRTMTLQLTN